MAGCLRFLLRIMVVRVDELLYDFGRKYSCIFYGVFLFCNHRFVFVAVHVSNFVLKGVFFFV